MRIGMRWELLCSCVDVAERFSSAIVVDTNYNPLLVLFESFCFKIKRKQLKNCMKIQRKSWLIGLVPVSDPNLNRNIQQHKYPRIVSEN